MSNKLEYRTGHKPATMRHSTSLLLICIILPAYKPDIPDEQSYVMPGVLPNSPHPPARNASIGGTRSRREAASQPARVTARAAPTMAAGKTHGAN